jgi:hypothetical protein
MEQLCTELCNKKALLEQDGLFGAKFLIFAPLTAPVSFSA